jgi:hypothetical protein
MLSTIYAYTFAFTFTTVLLIYLLKLPYLITGEVDLVNTYYGSNYRVNLPLDFLLISVYLSLATIANRYFEYTQLWQKIGIVALITMLISGSFYWIFTSYPKTSHFFSQWFHTVGFDAVLYDIVFVGITFIVYHFLKSTFERKKIL